MNAKRGTRCQRTKTNPWFQLKLGNWADSCNSMHGPEQWRCDVIGTNHTLKALTCCVLCQAEPPQWDIMGLVGNVETTCCSHMVQFWALLYKTLVNKGASNRSNKIGDSNIITLGLYRCEEQIKLPCNIFLCYM